MNDFANNIDYGYGSLEEAFPEADPGVVPFGSRVLCQLRTPKKTTRGGILLLDETRDTDQANTQVAKVRAVGELAFKNRNTMQPWPEGTWAAPGDFVRVPKYGGDRWVVKTEDGEEAIMILFDDLNLIGKVTGDPLAMKAFL